MRVKTGVTLGATSLMTLVAMAACDGVSAGAGETQDIPAAAGICAVVDAGRPLPDVVRETSGLARSVRDPGLFWTHNDSGHDPVLYGIAADGRLVQAVRVAGARQVDWEDLEMGPCDGGRCLFIGDIGDNAGARDHITVYRVPEPAPDASVTAPVTAFHARYPGGPRDAEGLFVDAAGVIHVVTKGRRSSIELYRFPAASAPNETVMLERVRLLFAQPDAEVDRATAATASPDGRWVAIRTYRHLYLYPAAALATAEPVMADLAPLRELKGEAVVLADDGALWTTSEAESRGEQPRWSRMQCTLPDPASRQGTRTYSMAMRTVWTPAATSIESTRGGLFLAMALISPLRSRRATCTASTSSIWEPARSAARRSSRLMWLAPISFQSISPSLTSTRGLPLSSGPSRSEWNVATDSSQCSSTSIAPPSSAGRMSTLVMPRLTTEPSMTAMTTSSAVFRPSARFSPMRTSASAPM